MPSSKPLTQRRAVRALAEGARPTIALLADASGRSPRTLKLEAEREGWALDRAPQEDIAERVRVVARMLLERFEALGRAALEEGGTINKAEIDTIIALIRGLDKFDEFMRPEAVVRENQIRQDEDLGDVLQRINERVVELAYTFAAEMAEQADRHGRGGAGQG
jgi:acyl-CoA reductase-like NAD-dependent aldehyde dehydrogenase